MNNSKRGNEITKKLTVVGILTAVVTVLSFIKIPIMGASVTLVLPVVVVGAVMYGPLVAAWLTVIPNIVALGESALFMTYSLLGTILTMFAKGIFAGLMAGLVYKLLAKKHQTGGVIAASVVAPTVNSGVFVLGCYMFIWDALVELAKGANVGIGLLLFGLAGLNFIIEMILNIVLCPAVLRIIEIAKKKNLIKNK